MSSNGQAHEWRKTYEAHGVEFGKDAAQLKGMCPVCGKGKFFVNSENGLWDCKVCGTNGNPVEFLRAVHSVAVEATSEDDYAALAAERRFLSASTPRRWGLALSPFTGEWLVPGYNVDGSLCTLYRWAERTPGGKRALMATPNVGHYLHAPLEALPFPQEVRTVYVTEGPWDAMALEEVLGKARETEEGLMPTEGRESLLKGAVVLAAPGANVFFDGWCPLLSEKDVNLLYDSDPPRVNPKTKAPIPPAGYEGMKAAAGKLLAAKIPPKSVKYLQWGPDGYEEESAQKVDVRDVLAGGKNSQARVVLLSSLLPRLVLTPPEWKAENEDEKPLPCKSWRVLMTSWRKSMKMTEGLDRAIAFSLAVAMSTEIPGEQLWGKLVGPPSSGKSTICEALSVARKYVKALSNFRGFHSGFKSDREGKEDNSLIPMIQGKTLIVKDGDTLLRQPNLPQILAEARDIYDRVSRSTYRNQLNREYTGINMTWLLCGTSSLRELDSSELGQRFLDCVIMNSISEEMEREVAGRKANQMRLMMASLGNGVKAGGRDGESPEMITTKRLTGGYLAHLRDGAEQLLRDVTMDDETAALCESLGTFVAYMRARPSKTQDEEINREFSPRLVSQFVKLAYCLSAVTQEKSVNASVVSRLRAVALDTARGKTFDMVGSIFRSGEEGLEQRGVGLMSNMTEEKAGTFIRFLRSIGAVEVFRVQLTSGLKSNPRYRLARRMKELYVAVTGEEAPAPKPTKTKRR